MEVTTTIQIEAHIIEASFYYDEYYDDASGERVLVQELDTDRTDIISVVDTEQNQLYRWNTFADKYWDLVNKWLESNDPIEDGIG